MANSEPRRIRESLYQFDPGYRPQMRVPVRVVADPLTLAQMVAEPAFEQLLELASLPGAEGFALGLPNLNESLGFPAGAVLATAFPDGVIAPSGAGPDLNCGLRLLASRLREPELAPRLQDLLGELARAIPVGTEHGGPLPLSDQELDRVLEEGCLFLVRERGLGTVEDLGFIESSGHFHGGHASHLSAQAKTLGHRQLGTLGSGGSHFVEVQVVDRVLDRTAADRFGLFEGQVLVMLHAGARALGHQVYSECLTLAREAMDKYRLPAQRFELTIAPLSSQEGMWCYHALRAAANFGWSNRQVLTHQVRSSFGRIFGSGQPSLQLVYDLGNNSVQIERVGDRLLCVHRRGAACAFGPGSQRVPPAYRDLGQPIFLPGSMGAASYVLVAEESARELSLSSACHGAGRTLSRRRARKAFKGAEVERELKDRGVLIHSSTHAELGEEAPGAFRDAERTAELMRQAGIARPVARLQPRAVLKG